MTLQQVLNVIRKQAALQKKVTELYEIESCEVLALDAIHNYYIQAYPDNTNLTVYPTVPDDEKWMLINYLFIDYISDKIALDPEPDIAILFEAYHKEFYATH
jgi:hypothetical protein